MAVSGEAFSSQVFGDALGYFRLLSIYVGLRLGLYQALGDADRGLSAAGLADRAEIDERYAREWLEQQATAGILEADVSTDPNVFWLPAGAAEALLDPDSLAFSAATVQQLLSLRGVIDDVIDAFRHGGGLPYAAFGDENVDGQGGANRPVLQTTFPNEWLPAIQPFHERLSSGPARVLDIGCGHGWSSIAIARAYLSAEVDGYDPDPLSVRRATQHADEASLSDRVRFHEADAASIEGPADLAMAFECVHDMSDPVAVLGAARTALVDEGAMLVVDERTREAFDGTADERESYFYGWSIFDCLPSGRAGTPSAATGAVMRPETLRGYATAAGFTRFDVLPIEHDTFRLYLLQP